MTAKRLEFSRDYPFSPTILWDAVIDPELVSGWLGEARIDPRVGGVYDLLWVGATDYRGTEGSIESLVFRESLVVVTQHHGRIELTLTEFPGGPRSTSTNLSVAVTLEVDDAFADRVRAHWELALDQLAELLRGHPVEWSRRAAGGSSSQVRRDFGGV